MTHIRMTLRVSDGLSVQHQEFKTVHTATGICLTNVYCCMHSLEPKRNLMEGIRKAMNERNLNESQWEDRKQWSLGVGQRRTTF